MGIAERREREKERLRTRVVEAARDILSEKGLDALSMRAIAERIEYSPATIYLYFRDKDELVQEVVKAGFQRLNEYMLDELRELGAEADAAEQFLGTGRAYVRFALENTAYFRVMFELPKAASVECPAPSPADALENRPVDVVQVVQRAVDEGMLAVRDASEATVIGWALVHGLVSLFLSGHLQRQVQSIEAFTALVESALLSLYGGIRVR